MKFDCPHCKQSLDAEKDMEGQAITCPSCNRNLLVPLSTMSVTHAALVHGIAKGDHLLSDGSGSATSPELRHIIITDIQISLWSLIVFLFKFAIASILVGIVIWGIIFMLSMAGCAALLGGLMSAFPAPHP